MTYQTMEVRPIAGALGAEIYGADLRDRDDSPVWGELRQAFLEHHVIAVRGQSLSPEDLMRVGGKFGEPAFYPFAKGMEGFPYIHEVIKREGETENFGNDWHTDTMYTERPPRATLLYAVETPPRGGDTLYVNTAAAYDALSDGMKRTLDSLKAVHSANAQYGVDGGSEASRNNAARSMKPATSEDAKAEVVHPVVRTHPETGKRALYVNIGFTTGFDGWTKEESRALLRWLYEHCAKPEFTCRFVWTKNAVAFWDNRCAQHYALNDYHGFRREMHRVTVEGDRPR